MNVYRNWNTRNIFQVVYKKQTTIFDFIRFLEPITWGFLRNPRTKPTFSNNLRIPVRFTFPVDLIYIRKNNIRYEIDFLGAWRFLFPNI